MNDSLARMEATTGPSSPGTAAVISDLANHSGRATSPTQNDSAHEKRAYVQNQQRRNPEADHAIVKTEGSTPYASHDIDTCWYSQPSSCFTRLVQSVVIPASAVLGIVTAINFIWNRVVSPNMDLAYLDEKLLVITECEEDEDGPGTGRQKRSREAETVQEEASKDSLTGRADTAAISEQLCQLREQLDEHRKQMEVHVAQQRLEHNDLAAVVHELIRLQQLQSANLASTSTDSKPAKNVPVPLWHSTLDTLVASAASSEEQQAACKTIELFVRRLIARLHYPQYRIVNTTSPSWVEGIPQHLHHPAVALLEAVGLVRTGPACYTLTTDDDAQRRILEEVQLKLKHICCDNTTNAVSKPVSASDACRVYESTHQESAPQSDNETL